MKPAAIHFTAEAWKALQDLAEKAYPNEGCGLMLGPLQKESHVHQIVLLHNTLLDEGRGRFNFSFSPKEFMDAQMAAEKLNLDVVGIFHTHPDHPPRPSPTDESQPMLAGWINVIASVVGAHFKEAKAWWREDEKDRFQEITLIFPR